MLDTVCLSCQEVPRAEHQRSSKRIILVGASCLSCARGAHTGVPTYTWTELVSKAKAFELFSTELREVKARLDGEEVDQSSRLQGKLTKCSLFLTAEDFVPFVMYHSLQIFLSYRDQESHSRSANLRFNTSWSKVGGEPSHDLGPLEVACCGVRAAAQRPALRALHEACR